MAGRDIADGLSRLRSTLKSVLASRWVWPLLTLSLRPRGVSVLTYHRILGVRAEPNLAGLPVDVFESQMRWVREHCDPIAPDAIVERATRPAGIRPAVLITFDDGFRDFHDLAYPVLKRLGIPALVFLATSHMDDGQMLWTEQVQWAAHSTTRASLRLPWAKEQTVALPDADARAALGRAARRYLKTLPNPARQTRTAELLAELGTPPPRPREMLTWQEVRAVADNTWFGGHSHTHPIMSRLTRAELESEVATCRDRITAETGRTPTMFAYPNGGPADYNAETQVVLKQHGFHLVFCTTEGIAGPKTDWMAIPRLAALDNAAPGPLAWRLAGMHLYRSSSADPTQDDRY